MICSSSSPPIRRRPCEGRGPRGFTLVELMVVILILAALIALLLPALSGAVKTARNAAVGAEINQLAQALASFKAQYGDYPPSRIYLAEDGNYNAVTSIQSLSIAGTSQDITLGQLAQRSVSALRKFFPRVVLNTSGGAVFTGPNYPRWYDFNGNGVVDPPYILQGHECLVFFLGGIPLQTASGYGMTGFGKDPTNPFTNSLTTSSNYSNNRQAPFFEFNPSRLVPDPSNPYAALLPTPPQIPGYLDSLSNTLGNGQINFYAYFSAYGNGGYDPNDVNFTETDAYLNGPIGLTFHVTFPVPVGGTTTNISVSPAPNPYTSALTAPYNGTIPLATTYFNPQTFQIISSGVDGLYGVGGQYTPNATGETLPLDPNLSNYVPSPLADNTIRVRERDNITNFHNGKLE
jgi:prepilin-type N-terminal cleavage/methylation domain-containing protein